ncbi:MAG TPA: methyltransferase domain-containing protein, partial [Gammaproteobacteria bacterium]
MSATSPFDDFAADYDRRFSHRQPAIWLRAAVHARIEPLLVAGAEIIELGCGTGEDSIWFARRGCRVRATDASAGMLAQARKKIGVLGLDSQISLQQLDLADWRAGDMASQPRARIVFSNFGALNCIEDLRPVFGAASECLETGGYLAVTLMGRFCLSETIFFGARGQFTKAARRWSGSSAYRAGGEEHPVWYHAPAEVRRAAEGFREISISGVGALLPPSEGFGLCERWPRVSRRL